MSREEAIKELTELLPEEFLAEYSEAIRMAIEALEQKPCGDCISRDAVMHILDEVGGDFDSPREAVVPIDYIADMVSELPFVTAQPKMGRWVKTIGENGVTSALRCSECGFEDNRYELFNYCPECGADMRGEE